MNRAFIFPGQGSQSIGMGRELYENFSVARDVFHEVDDAMSLKLSKIILEGPDDELTLTQNTQPALMCVSIAACRVIEAFCEEKIDQIASIAAGHSLGQYAALCAMGALELSDCAKILVQRGKFMQESSITRKGAMAAVIGASAELMEVILLESAKLGICQIANDNSADQIVISGEENAVDFAVAAFKERGAKAIKLKVSAAFHSKLMEDAVVKMKPVLYAANLQEPKKPIIDNVSLSLQQDSDFIKQKLLEQIPGRVRWRETMDIIASRADSVFEIGPGKVLTSLFKKSHPNFPASTLFSINEIEEFCKSCTN